MRLYGLVFVFGMVGIAATQSIIGGAPKGEAVETAAVLSIEPGDICEADFATPPVFAVEDREIVVAEAFKELEVEPPVFGTVTETLVLVPAHREGATFFTERERIIVSEPTRKLTVMPATFGSAPALETLFVGDVQVQDGKLIDTQHALDPMPEKRIVMRKAQIQAVRVNAGLEMREIKVIDTDGEGASVPAETTTYERRTVETHPVVHTREIPRVTERVAVQVMRSPAARSKAPAVCEPQKRNDLIAAAQKALIQRGFEGIETDGNWTPATVDAIALLQHELTGKLSASLLLEALPLLLPQVSIPSS